MHGFSLAPSSSSGQFSCCFRMAFLFLQICGGGGTALYATVDDESCSPINHRPVAEAEGN